MASEQLASDTSPGGSRILIVDDDQDMVEIFADVLSELGFETRIARDGLTALSIAQSFRPNVCLLDIGMPGMDGYEIAAKLRGLTGLREDMRIIAITGYGQDVDRQRSLDAGFHAHLVKPVNLDTLTKLVAGS
jgi:CheY-like chemotaxis protein